MLLLEHCANCGCALVRREFNWPWLGLGGGARGDSDYPLVYSQDHLVSRMADS